MTRRLFNKAVSVFLGLLFVGKLPAAQIKTKPVSDLLFRIRRQHYWEVNGPCFWAAEAEYAAQPCKKSTKQVWHVCIKCPNCGWELVSKYTNIAGLLRNDCRDLIVSDVRQIVREVRPADLMCDHCRGEYRAVSLDTKAPNIDFAGWAKFVETTCRPGAINS